MSMSVFATKINSAVSVLALFKNVRMYALLFTGCFGAYCYLATFYNEEVRMVGTFGKSYEEYMGRVPAFCPYLSGPKNKSE